LDIRIRLQTHYPAGYPIGKPNNDHLCYLLSNASLQTKTAFKTTNWLLGHLENFEMAHLKLSLTSQCDKTAILRIVFKNEKR